MYCESCTLVIHNTLSRKCRGVLAAFPFGCGARASTKRVRRRRAPALNVHARRLGLLTHRRAWDALPPGIAALWALGAHRTRAFATQGGVALPESAHMAPELSGADGDTIFRVQEAAQPPVAH